jgi:type I restriction enzyme S subunit
MKEGWVQMKLGDVCDFQGGSQPPKSQFIYSPQEGYVRFLQIRDFASDKNITYIPESKKNRHCNEEDILLGRYGASVGKVLTNKAGAYNVAVIKSIPEVTIINKGYLFYYFNTFDFQSRLIKTASRSAQDGFSKEDIYDFPVLIPPLQEQQRIVSIIDKSFEAIDKAIENTQKNLQNAKELFESYLNSVFENVGEDWVNKRLQDVAFAFGRGKSKHRPRNWEGLFNGIYPFIQTGEVRNANKYIETYEKSYNDVGLAQSKLWLKGTICITIAANIAETAILAIDACIPDSIIGLQIDPQKANLDFTYYLLQHYRTELQKLGKGSAQDNLNLGSFDNLYFPFPSVKEQIEIVSKLDALMAESEQLQIIYRQKLLDLEELKKSVLNKAFAGEL